MDSLNVVHISGTKGKGSTCAFCESILRSHGYRTGFYRYMNKLLCLNQQEIYLMLKPNNVCWRNEQ